MEFSEQINELAAALAKAQAEMGNAKKSSANPYFKSKYADLAEVLDTCREVLGKNGLSVVQPVGQVNDKNIEVHTMLLHSSGQWVKSTMNIPMVKLDPQAAGSAITYARRYSLAAMVGIAQADDDSESAMAHDEQPTKQPEGKGQPTVITKGGQTLVLGNKGYRTLKGLTLEQLNTIVNNKDYAACHDEARELMAKMNDALYSNQ